MIELEINDTIFNSLDILSIKIELDVIKDFIEVINRDTMPDEFVLDSIEGTFKINKLKKEFRILKRNYYSKRKIALGFPNDYSVDIQVCVAYKVAQASGFKVFLEPKYLN